MQSKGYICTCTCPVVLHCFVDICQQVLGLFFTYDTTCNLCNLLAGICNHQRKRVWLGGGGGGQLAPTPKAMLDPGLHGTYLDLS